MINYLEIDEVLAINFQMIKLFGGKYEVRDFLLLDSALNRPKASFGGVDLYKNIFDKATAMLHSLIMNHVFADGNKRTAITSCARFLYINGWKLTLNREKTIRFMIDVEAKKYSLKEISAWLKKHSKKK